MIHDAYLSSPRAKDPVVLHTTSLIDSGCTAMAFADDESIVKQFNIIKKPLVNPGLVRLTDSSTQATISYYFTSYLHLGQHTEILVFFVTNLSKNNLIILGIPRLKLHNAICDWSSMTLNFNSPYCHHYCLSWRQPQVKYPKFPQDLKSCEPETSVAKISAPDKHSNLESKTSARCESLSRKVDQEDINKFLKTKPELTIDDVKCK